MLEDIFSARSEIMLRINVIRNAAHRITNAIELQSSSPSEPIAEARSKSEALEESVSFETGGQSLLAPPD